jgi:hypothetical protein
MAEHVSQATKRQAGAGFTISLEGNQRIKLKAISFSKDTQPWRGMENAAWPGKCERFPTRITARIDTDDRASKGICAAPAFNALRRSTFRD